MRVFGVIYIGGDGGGASLLPGAGVRARGAGVLWVGAGCRDSGGITTALNVYLTKLNRKPLFIKPLRRLIVQQVNSGLIRH